MKNILFVHSGGFWKDYTFKKAKQLGYGVILAQKNYTGNNPHIDKVIDVDVYDAQAAASLISQYKNEIHGVTTFFELAVEANALVAENLDLIGNSCRAAQNSRDKYKMRQCFKEHGIPSVEAFSLATNPEDVKKFGKSYGYPIILKPTNFGAAAGVVRINNEADVERLFDFVKTEIDGFCKTYKFPNNKTALMAETMINPKATEVNADMIIHNGEPLVVSIAEKPQDTTGPTFQENDYVMPPFSLRQENIEAVKDAAVKAVKALGLKYGAAHLESKVIEGEGKFNCYVVEVGARCGGDLEVPAVRASAGVDLSEIVIKQAMGDFTDADFTPLKDSLTNRKLKPVAVQVIYAPKNGVIKEIIVPDPVKNDPRLLEMKFEYHPNDKVNMHYSDYVGAIMVTEESPKKALKLVNDVVSSIKVKMC